MRQKYISGWILGMARKIDSGISPTPPLICIGCQKVRNLAFMFDPIVAFELMWFRSAATYRWAILRRPTACAVRFPSRQRPGTAVVRLVHVSGRHSQSTPSAHVRRR